MANTRPVNLQSIDGNDDCLISPGEYKNEVPMTASREGFSDQILRPDWA